MNFGANILKYRDEILNDIKALVAIPSCAAQESPGLPYGKEAAAALSWILGRAGEMGFATKNIQNYAGHAEYGEGGDLNAVLCHVDVVPPGEGWETEPFHAVMKQNKLYGRGVADDKGAAVVALYCLKALKDANIQGKRRLRAIFGSGEEVGMNDLARYFEVEEMPSFGFTPDSDYGICNCEKGILQVEISADVHDGTILNALRGGGAVNAVPDIAAALIDCTENEDHQLMRLADAKEGDYTFQYTMDGLKIISRGKSAHAMQPQKGLNAVTHLIDLLTSNFGYDVLGSLCAFLDDAVRLETDGLSLGIKQSDEMSGELTVNVGIVDIGPNHMRACLDIRYPVSADAGKIIQKITDSARMEGLHFSVMNHNPPLYLPQDSEKIKLLKKAYRDVTGEEPSVYSTGGGTYARTLRGNGVAFGPLFHGEESRLHEAGENIDVDELMLHAQICLQAMYLMLTED